MVSDLILAVKFVLTITHAQTAVTSLQRREQNESRCISYSVRKLLLSLLL